MKFHGALTLTLVPLVLIGQSLNQKARVTTQAVDRLASDSAHVRRQEDLSRTAPRVRFCPSECVRHRIG
jgi:hypothetical protein